MPPPLHAAGSATEAAAGLFGKGKGFALAGDGGRGGDAIA